jgi:hypothetical protein
LTRATSFAFLSHSFFSYYFPAYCEEYKFRKPLILRGIPVSSDFKLLDDVKQHLCTCSAGLKLTPDMEAFLEMPMRELYVSLPVHMDDGSIKVFKGSGSSTTKLWGLPKEVYVFIRRRRWRRSEPLQP